MLPILHFWLGFPAPLAIGTTLFAVIFTAISGGYGHLKQRNLDSRAVLYLGGFGIVGVLIGSWLFTLLSDQSKLLGFILGLVFLWPALRTTSRCKIMTRILKEVATGSGGLQLFFHFQKF